MSQDFSYFLSRTWSIPAWQVSKYGAISGLYFPVFRLNMEIYSVNLRIQSEYRKIRTRNNSVFGHFSMQCMYVIKIIISDKHEHFCESKILTYRSILLPDIFVTLLSHSLCPCFSGSNGTSKIVKGKAKQITCFLSSLILLYKLLRQIW